MKIGFMLLIKLIESRFQSYLEGVLKTIKESIVLDFHLQSWRYNSKKYSGIHTRVLKKHTDVEKYNTPHNDLK